MTYDEAGPKSEYGFGASWKAGAVPPWKEKSYAGASEPTPELEGDQSGGVA